MNYALYTTSKSPWFQQKANDVAAEWSKTKGRGKVSIEVIHTEPPRSPHIITDSDGDKRFSWDWFSQRFPKRDYDGVFFHFTPYYKKKWGISPRINGSKNTRNKEYPEFWLSCEREFASGYDTFLTLINGKFRFLTEFERLMHHEMAHFDEDLDDTTTNTLHQSLVHFMDYKRKQIHQFHYLVDYRWYNYRKKLNELYTKVITLAKRVLTKTTAL